MPINIKSVIFDIADNWGSTYNVALRSIEFYFQGTRLSLVEGVDFTVYATSQYSATFAASNIFNLSASKVGSQNNTSWLSANRVTTGQRVGIVFTVPLEFDAIVVNNHHSNGSGTNNGAKNVVITGSTDAITSTVYNESITNSTELYNGVLREHIAWNMEDQETVYGDPLEGVIATGVIVAKSMVIDIRDHWGPQAEMGIRSIEFFRNDTLIALTTEFTAYGDSSAGAVPARIFDTRLLKTGNFLQGWYKNSSSFVRVSVVFDAEIEFDKVVINNGHSAGAYTYFSVKNVKVYTSTDVIPSIVYGEPVTNKSLLFSGELAEHIASNAEDPQTVYEYTAEPVEPGDLTLLRLSFSQLYHLNDSCSFRASFIQEYALLDKIVAAFSQVYGIRTALSFVQYYKDSPRLRKKFSALYSSLPTLRKSFVQEYGDNQQLFVAFVQEYAIRNGLVRGFAQQYTLSEDSLRKGFAQLYKLNECDLLRLSHVQPYVLAADATMEDGSCSFELTDIGKQLNPHSFIVEHDKGSYFLTVDLHLADQHQFALCKKNLRLLTEVDGEFFQTVIHKSPRRSINPGVVDYIVETASPLVYLGAGPSDYYSCPVSGEFSGMASDIVSSLAATKGFSVNWEIIDWMIPQGRLLVNNRTPIEIIRDIVHEVRGIVQPTPDGNMRIIYEYPDPVSNWESVKPALKLVDQDHYGSATENPIARTGHNKFLISDSDSSQSRWSLDDVGISPTQKYMDLYTVPFAPAIKPVLQTSSDGVTIEPLGVVEKEISEVIVIKNGVGRATKPIYGVIGTIWADTHLGDVSFSEDSQVKTSVLGQSLLTLSYTTKFHRWLTTNPQSKKVLFYAK